MAELLRTRCAQGTLIITDSAIRVELGTIKQQSLARSSLTGIDLLMAYPNIFGLGRTNMVFHGQGTERLQANLVPTNIAREIKSLLDL